MITHKPAKLLLTFAFLFTPLMHFAQKSTSSPYSIYGLGDMESKGFAVSSAMGDVKYGLIHPSFINVANPASYAVISRPVFEVGITSSFLTLTADTSKQSTNDAYLRNITFAFPVIKKRNRWGLSFGLVPYAKMGYSISAKETIMGADTIDVDYLYEGKGNISQFYIGNAFSIIKDSVQQLAVGFNASYLFGNLEKTRRIIPESAFGGYKIKDENNTSIGDIYFDFGAFYKRKFKNFNIVVGGYYALADSLRAKNTTSTVSYTGTTGFEDIKDTIFADIDTGKIFLPQTFGAGVSFTIKNKLTIAADYSAQYWADYLYFGQQQGLTSRDQFSFGLQYVPDKAAVTDFFKTIRYRAGFRYAHTRLNLNGVNLLEYGISFGVGVPLVKAHSAGTSFNIGMEYGQRGRDENGLILEQFVNLNIGFTFTPHKFDKWFKKRKID